MIESDLFRVEASAYVMAKARGYLFRWLWAFVAIYAVIIWAAIRDVRFVYVGLIVTFIVWPMLLTFAWIDAAFSPETIARTRLQKIVISGSGISFSYYRPGANNQPPECVEVEEHDFAGLKSVELRGRYVHLVIADGFLRLIPLEVVGREGFARLRDSLPSDDEDLA